jgi:hypothetical protein
MTTGDHRRALALLASFPNGCTVSVMRASVWMTLPISRPPLVGSRRLRALMNEKPTASPRPSPET